MGVVFIFALFLYLRQHLRMQRGEKVFKMINLIERTKGLFTANQILQTPRSYSNQANRGLAKSINFLLQQISQRVLGPEQEFQREQGRWREVPQVDQALQGFV